MIPIPAYNPALADVALYCAEKRGLPVTVNQMQQCMVDGMRADLWLKHNRREVYNPNTRKKEA